MEPPKSTRRPGSAIASTLPVLYGSYSGTSMATPHVTGAFYAARILIRRAASALLSNTTETSSLAGKPSPAGLDVSKLMDASEELPNFSISDVSVNEGDSGTTPLTFTVDLSAPSDVPTTVNFATANDSADAADYQSISGDLTFSPGETSKTMTVLINGDLTLESNEMLFVNLSGSVNAGISDGQGIGTIINDDNVPSL
jgi:hypothetical protein